jgi:hypothetical protein
VPRFNEKRPPTEVALIGVSPMNRQNLFRGWVALTIMYWVVAGSYELREIAHGHVGAHPWLQNVLGVSIALAVPAFVLLIGRSGLWVADRWKSK